MKYFLLSVLALVARGGAVTFELSGSANKCLFEDVHKDVLVVGDYDIGPDDGVPDQNNQWLVDLETKRGNSLKVKITDSKDHRVYHKQHADAGKFAFTSDDYDTYKICFTQTAPNEANPPNYDNHVEINVKLGVEAKSYDDVGKAEHLSKMEVQMRRLEDLAESIVTDFADMKRREEEHRDTNESTNDRMLWFSIFSMVCLLVLACGQVMYLKNFFKSKKLID